MVDGNRGFVRTYLIQRGEMQENIYTSCHPPYVIVLFHSFMIKRKFLLLAPFHSSDGRTIHCRTYLRRRTMSTLKEEAAAALVVVEAYQAATAILSANASNDKVSFRLPPTQFDEWLPFQESIGTYFEWYLEISAKSSSISTGIGTSISQSREWQQQSLDRYYYQLAHSLISCTGFLLSGKQARTRFQLQEQRLPVFCRECRHAC